MTDSTPTMSWAAADSATMIQRSLRHSLRNQDALLMGVSVALGLLARSVEGASGFTFFVLFLPYLSSAFVSTATMPAALRAAAEHQPDGSLRHAAAGPRPGPAAAR